MGIEMVNWLITASGTQIDRPGARQAITGDERTAESRNVFIGGKPHSVQVYQRSLITAADSIAGPAIIEERETTIFILENWVATLHASGSIVAEKTKGAS